MAIKNMMQVLHKNWVQQTGVALLAVLLFLPGVGNMPLFDWDEINFAECAREMLASGNYSEVQLYFQPFWEKPPLFIWLQAFSMKWLGVNELAARLPNVVCGVLTLMLVFNLGKRHFSLRTGWLWVLLFTGSLLPHLYFKSGIIDPWFNLFIFLSVYFFILFSNYKAFKQQWFYALLSGICIGLAVLTKGPVAILISSLVIVVWMVIKRQFRLWMTGAFWVFVLSALLMGSAWFIYEIANGKWNVVEEFITYQIRLFSTEDADHGGPFVYHFVILLVGCFPASLVFLSGWRNKENLTPFQLHFRLVVLILFWVVLILFSVVKTKIVHYSSLCYLPLTGIAAVALSTASGSGKIAGWNKVLFWLIGGLFSLLFVAAGCFKWFKGVVTSREVVPDDFTRANFKAEIPWWGWEWLLGIVFLGACMYFFRMLQKGRTKELLYGLFGLSVCVMGCLNVFIPRGELISQRAAIDFYRQCANHDCYVESVRFKSYAPLFYAQRMPEHFTDPGFIAFLSREQKAYLERGESPIKYISLLYTRWLLESEVNKPVYFVCKIQNEKELFTNLRLRKLYSKNGFSFFVKMPIIKGI